MKKTWVYVVQEIAITETMMIGGVVYGVYTKMSLAKKAARELRKRNKKKSVIYDIVPMEVNSIPVTDLEIEDAIEDLINKGFMEAMVGEDGRFYYELTDLGRKIAEDENKDNNEDDKGGDTGID